MDSFQNRVQSTLNGGNDFIAKPFHLAELGVKALFWVFKGQIERSSLL
jgi:DNA-binding response OmpR family regulator